MNNLIKRRFTLIALLMSLFTLGGCGTSFESSIGGPVETSPSFPDSPSRSGTGWETSSDGDSGGSSGGGGS